MSGPCPIRETHEAIWRKTKAKTLKFAQVSSTQLSVTLSHDWDWFSSFSVDHISSSVFFTDITLLPSVDLSLSHRCALGLLFICKHSLWVFKCIYRHDRPHRHFSCFWFFCLAWYSCDTKLWDIIQPSFEWQNHSRSRLPRQGTGAPARCAEDNIVTLQGPREWASGAG